GTWSARHAHAPRCSTSCATAYRSPSRQTPDTRAAGGTDCRRRQPGAAIMPKTDAIIIGAGQAGLALSHCLSRLGIDHVMLERGQVAERWHSERWDSLRLLTPNWMNRLPGWSYQGSDPDGFMTAGDFATYLQRYAATSCAPVVTGTAVRSVHRGA